MTASATTPPTPSTSVKAATCQQVSVSLCHTLIVRDVLNRLSYMGSVSILFLKKTDLVRNEFGSVGLKKAVSVWMLQLLLM